MKPCKVLRGEASYAGRLKVQHVTFIFFKIIFSYLSKLSFSDIMRQLICENK